MRKLSDQTTWENSILIFLKFFFLTSRKRLSLIRLFLCNIWINSCMIKKMLQWGFEENRAVHLGTAWNHGGFGPSGNGWTANSARNAFVLEFYFALFWLCCHCKQGDHVNGELKWPEGISNLHQLIKYPKKWNYRWKTVIMPCFPYSGSSKWEKVL